MINFLKQIFRSRPYKYELVCSGSGFHYLKQFRQMPSCEELNKIVDKHLKKLESENINECLEFISQSFNKRDNLFLRKYQIKDPRYTSFIVYKIVEINSINIGVVNNIGTPGCNIIARNLSGVVEIFNHYLDQPSKEEFYQEVDYHAEKFKKDNGWKEKKLINQNENPLGCKYEFTSENIFKWRMRHNIEYQLIDSMSSNIN